MIVESLSLQNFMRYKQRCSLDLGNKRTIGIVGANESGKSSLLQAVSYGTYGRTRAEREVQLINDSADGDLVVDLALRFPDDTLLEITRGRTKKNEAVLKVAGMSDSTKPSDLQRHIEEVVKLSYEDYIALTYFVQGDMHQFMSGNKRAYFQRWTSGLRLWQKYEASASTSIMEVEENISQATYELQQCNEALELSEETKGEARAAKIEVEQAKSEVDLVGEQVEHLHEQYQEVAESGTEVKEVTRSLSSEVTGLQGKLSRTSTLLSQAKRELSSISTGRCPILDASCDLLKESGKPKREQARKDISRLEAESSRLKKELVAARRRLKQADEKADATYKRALGEVSAQLKAAQADLRDANTRLRRATVRRDKAKAAIGRLKEAKRLQSEVTKDKQAWETELRRLQFVRYMCSRSGIPLLLIEGELERVEDRCNWVLERLDYPKRIRFSGFKELAGYEKVCPACGGETWHKQQCKGCGTARPKKRRDEPTVTVLDGQVERPFALESGGAQTLQSFAARLACGLFVSNMSSVPMRMVMLDEVFGFLDAANRQKLMSLVIDKLATEFGLLQQFVVSHQEDVVNAVDDLLVVTSERGSAVARWA